ncbi:hydantoinase/oxoprolinase family protein [Corynebacterium hylobatis]|uniref:Hydantoinase/oxoprolinase family protein n=1 Tax=Corynebacterium hylobatis TaxID=1859290 RepID=A0A430HZ11_9CORY|nr:hydantoinase/oxoprolinase family protein [Corynebacterium hylobatis]RSZ63815.1 hydantoinase/oxoprolinase family protein [Corynebacterium hylobatis]
MHTHDNRREELQVAVDTGGTFTDIGVRRADGSLSVWKVPSTPAAPDDAVITGITGALEQQGGAASDITRLVHGTTVATNTVLTRDGARIGLLTTRGFRDVLAIGHQARPALYDNRVHRVPPLIPEERIVEVDERMSASGEVLMPLQPGDLDALAPQLRELELDTLVVSFLNAYRNDAHEQLAVARLRELGAAPLITAATDITSEMREYDRTSTAAVNAYVQPKMAGYMGRLVESVTEIGVPSRLWVMQSSGGLLNPAIASTHSARTVLSGLAGGVVGAANWARHLGLDKVVSFDIGGTSTDIALIRAGEPDETTAGEIDSMPLRLPSVDVHTIGAGGGSIAWRDSGGGLRVGPHSAGAEPGPIAYGRGGVDLTVTDAHLVLGRLGTDLLGGRFTLDREAAYSRMTEFGAELGLGPEECAEGILRVIAATMARGIRRVSVERGIDVRSCHLMAFGGAGPLHGADLVHELGMESAVIPPLPGIASAVGMLDAPVRHDFAAPVQADAATGFAGFEEAFQDLRERAIEEMGTFDFGAALLVDARYTGQSYELTVPWAADWAAQREAFDLAHEERYGFRDPDAEMEIIVVRLVATIGQPVVPQEQLGAAGTGAVPKHRRPVFIQGTWVDTPVYARADLPAGEVLTGPAILDQFDTTTYIRPDQQCRCDEYGFLHLTRKGES